MNRRQFLASGVTGSMVVTGCLGNDDSTIRLAGLRVANFLDEPIAVDVAVQRDDSTVLAEELTLGAAADGAGSTSVRRPIACTWGQEVGAFVIDARVNGGEWASVEIANHLATVPEEFRDVVAVELEVYRAEEIVFNPKGCDLLTTGSIPPWTCPWLEC